MIGEEGLSGGGEVVLATELFRLFTLLFDGVEGFETGVGGVEIDLKLLFGVPWGVLWGVDLVDNELLKDGIESALVFDLKEGIESALVFADLVVGGEVVLFAEITPATLGLNGLVEGGERGLWGLLLFGFDCEVISELPPFKELFGFDDCELINELPPLKEEFVETDVVLEFGAIELFCMFWWIIV